MAPLLLYISPGWMCRSKIEKNGPNWPAGLRSTHFSEFSMSKVQLLHTHFVRLKIDLQFAQISKGDLRGKKNIYSNRICFAF